MNNSTSDIQLLSKIFIVNFLPANDSDRMAKPRLVQEKTVTREDKKVNNSNITIYVNFKTRNRKMKVFYFLFGDVSFKI